MALPASIVHAYEAADILSSGGLLTGWNDSVGTDHIVTVNSAPAVLTVPGTSYQRTRFTSGNYCTLPAALVSNSRSMSLYAVCRRLYSNTNAAYMLATGATDGPGNLAFLSTKVPAIYAGKAMTELVSDADTLFGIRCSASNAKIRWGGVTETLTTLTASNGTGGTLGRSQAGTLPFVGDIIAIYWAVTAISDADELQLVSHVEGLYKPHTRTEYFIVGDGDSFTNGNGTSTPLTDNGFLYRLRHLFATQPKIVGFGVPSQTLVSMASDAATQIDALVAGVSEATNKIVLAFGSNNDIATGTDAATALTNYWNYCDARRAAGYKVCAFTIPPRTDNTAGENVEKATFNAGVAANWQSHADYFANVALSPLDNAADTTNFNADGIHWNDAGAVIGAAVAYNALNPPAPSSGSPATMFGLGFGLGVG